MRYSLFLSVALLFLSSIASAEDSSSRPFAVVELFSSQGCSSCPSAELLLSKLTAWARQNNQPVYPLNFHVDYWNNLGWRDVFSREQYTQRQSEYAPIFKGQGLYTPQMVINGTDAFVGSDQDQLQQDLDHELSAPAGVTLHISTIKAQGQITVSYKSEGFSKGDVVHVALVERGLATDVTAGENAGRMLHQDNVVREFQTVPLAASGGEVHVPLARISDSTQASVIVYVQNPSTMLIEAAQQLDLEPQ